MTKRSFFARALRVAIAGIGLALGLSFPAGGLTLNEAGRVTALLAELAPEIGPYSYDEEEADRIYDDDAGAGGRIAAAGFSRDAWREAVDAAFRGYLATIPEEEFSRRVSMPMQRLQEADSLTDEQKAEIRAWAEEEIAKLLTMRDEGANHLEAVAPHAAEFDRLFGSEE